MKALLTLATIAAAGALAAPALADRPTGEDKLAAMLEGREAGEPARCINTLRGGGSLQIIDKTAIVFKEGRTLWVNRTAHPGTLDSDDYLVIRHVGGGSRLCRLDNVTSQSRHGNMFTGPVFLEDFVPYRRVEG